MEQECIFCKIVRREMPSNVIYEDENYLAFMDIFPKAKGHALIIPKKHYRWVYDVPEFGQYWEVAKKVGEGIQKKLEARYISFLTLGDEVPHAHIHILPQTGNGIQGIRFTETISMKKEEIQSLAKDIAHHL